MREARNPFRLRACQHIDSDVDFVRLCGPAMLSPLGLSSGDFSAFRIIRSAPGGGKTTQLRLFTPGPLKALHIERTQKETRELYKALLEAGAMNNDGPNVLGVLVSCATTFAEIADIGLTSVKQLGLFRAMLDVRLILACLRSLLQLLDLRFPADLNRIKVLIPSEAERPTGMTGSCLGKDLYDWAKGLEANLCSILYSLQPQVCELEGWEELIAPTLLAAANLQVDGRQIIQNTVLMLDDAHQLASDQRKSVVQELANKRAPAGVWIAERLSALSSDELLLFGATASRDYAPTIMLEAFWQRNRHEFRKFLENIADRRVDIASDASVASFAACIDDNIEGSVSADALRKACIEVENRVRTLGTQGNAFDSWIGKCAGRTGSPYSRAMEWRALEILMRRKLGKKQVEFDFELEEETYEKEDDTSVRNAAEIFLAQDYGWPYYYGLDRVFTLSSRNVEQFLALAGDLFEESASLALLGKPYGLSPVRQHELIVAASGQLWADVSTRAGKDVTRLLDSIGKFCAWYTFRPTAPNDPGVNGVAILMSDRAKLLDPDELYHHNRHRHLANVIARAIEFNLLEPVQDYAVKGNQYMVLNLNRLLCVKYLLPLGRGLFKEQRIETLCDWLERDFVAPKASEEMW